MAKAVTTYEANDGTKHLTAEAAAIADLAAILGHREPAHASAIMDNRHAIEAVFAELDALNARAAGGPKAVPLRRAGAQ